MNRAQRRNQQRVSIRDLRDEGCSCTPSLTPVPRWLWPAGALDGAFVLHELGCPLGNSVLAGNRAGIIPELHTYGRRCAR